MSTRLHRPDLWRRLVVMVQTSTHHDFIYFHWPWFGFLAGLNTYFSVRNQPICLVHTPCTQAGGA